MYIMHMHTHAYTDTYICMIEIMIDELSNRVDWGKERINELFKLLINEQMLRHMEERIKKPNIFNLNYDGKLE